MPERTVLLTRDTILEQMEPYSRTQLRPVADSSETRVMVDENTVVIRPYKGARAIEVESSEGLPNTLRLVGLPLDIAHALSPRRPGRPAGERRRTRQIPCCRPN